MSAIGLESDEPTRRWLGSFNQPLEVIDFSMTLVARLRGIGFNPEVWHTGGGCMAIICPLSDRESESGYRWEIMLTDGDAGLPTGTGGAVGLDDDEGQTVKEFMLCHTIPVSIDEYVHAAMTAAIWYRHHHEEITGSKSLRNGE